MNTVCITGRLVETPALSTTKNGKEVSTFRVAVRRDQNNTDFFTVVAWQGTAQHVCKWFQKGQMIAVEGRLLQNRFTDRDGKTRERVEIIAREVGFCGEAQKADTSEGAAAPQLQDIEEIVDGDLPF